MQYATDYHVYIRRDKRITTTYVMRDRWMNHWWASPGNAGRSGSRNSTDAPLHFGEAYNWIVCSSRVRAGFLLRSNEKPLNTHVRESLIRTQKGTKLRRNERGWTTTVSHAACVYPCRIVIVTDSFFVFPPKIDIRNSTLILELILITLIKLLTLNVNIISIQVVW